jgi:hypothetical protein
LFTHGNRAVLFLALCLGAAVQPCVGGGLHTLGPKRAITNGRFVAKIPLQGITSFGLNYESYIFEVETGDKHNTKQLIKFSYRFDQREPRLPFSFFDHLLTHKFRLTRDEECDESWEGMSSLLVFDSAGVFHGKQNALVYAKNAPVLKLDPRSMLACYVGTPQDYLFTAKSASSQAQLPVKQPAPATEYAPSEKSSSAKAIASASASTHKEQ